ncbi:MAG: PAS domain S-box protein [Sphingobacteriales bacterium]|nr:MAG: PAS domain S-box protein [Sphingobacteriales bacterium]
MPIPFNETERLQALKSYHILDTVNEKDFDRFTQLASLICEVPISLISLIDEDRQWFKSKVGIEVNETPRNLAFCQHAIMENHIFEIEDATKDNRFKSNPLVTNDPLIKFYAGQPLITPEGFALGTLCVIDRTAKVLTDIQKKSLELLAEEVVSLIVEKRQKEEIKYYEHLFNISNDMVCIAGIDGYFKKINLAFTAILGWDEATLLNTPFFDFIHPSDIENSKEQLLKLSNGEKITSFLLKFRTKENDYKYLEWACTPEIITGNIFAIARDITDEKLKEEKLKISEANFRSFFNNSQGLMCTHNLDGKFISVNQAGAKSLGYTDTEIVDFTLFDLIPQKNHPLLKKYLNKIKQFGKANGIMAIKNKNGLLGTWFFNNIVANDINGNQYVIGNAIDITEKHQLELDLIKTRNLLEQTNKIANVGGWELDLQTQELYWSDITKEIHEVPHNFTPKLDNALKYYKPGQNQTLINEAVNNAINFGTPWDLELQLITENKNEIWVRALGNAIINKGKCVKILGAFQNIDNRKKTELALASSQKKYKAFFNNSPIGISINTLDGGQFLQGNNAFLNMIGYTDEEYKDLNIKEITDVKYNDIDAFLIETLKKTGKYGPYEKEYIHKNGSIVPVVVNGISFIDENGENLVYSTVEDISERKNAEKVLEKERNRLKAFVQNAPAAVAMLDNNMVYIAASDKWKLDYKIPLEKNIIGELHYNILTNISDEWKKLHQRCLKGEILKKEEHVWRPAGWESDMYIKWEARPWYEINGEIGGLIMYVQDITNMCLQREELKQAKIIAEQASNAKSEFLANMSHEIRTPLNGVIGFTDLVLKSQLNETQFQYLSIINQSANSLLNIVNDILDFSKIEAGKMELDTVKCNLNELASEAIDIVKFQAEKKSLEILLNLPLKEDTGVFADSIRIKQILINLLSNAVKFTENGEVELKIIVLSTSNSQKTFRISVRDTGIGIEINKQAKIFEPFLQEDASTTKKYGGTGLGLTISNKLLEFMDTKLELVSQPGKGSSFYFDITLQSSHAKTENLPAISNIRNVLVVDDNTNNRLIVKDMLALNNIEVTEAVNGFDALEILSQNTSKFDVILMDYHMPYMDGIETIKKIKENFFKTTHKQPIFILFSSSDNEKIITTCKELNINTRLLKPVKITELYNSLSNLEILKPETVVKVEAVSNFNKILVLIAEDNPINALLAKTIILNIAPQAIIAEAVNGQEAVEFCNHNKPDMILMDIQMPIMNGYEATKLIREIPENAKTLIVALTAGNIKGEREKCLDAGMSDFVSKPIVENDLLELFNKWQTATLFG